MTRLVDLRLAEHGNSVRTELLAGTATLLTMAPIVFVNPDILAAVGMERAAVFVATCLAAALAVLPMRFTDSSADGLALGFSAHAALTLGSGRWRQVHVATWVIAAPFVLGYAL
jgi:adenine/guanine/hypoxanthine permease